ncbi:DUF2378 family protein [Archangium lipolyticum]|uniref:DUF2378 family protein n=1 Tax=Archangium lipolyticum TaxID=2970465 RepID=UPI00214A1C66|nr:DUF2378 family protein [Archangium lipolyticum]
MELATPEDTVRGMFLRGLLEAIGELGDEALVRRCREVSGHEEFVELFSYPVGLQLRLISVAMETLAGRLGGWEPALRLLGRRAASDFLGSNAGRMLLVMGGGEPKRLLNSTPTGYRVSLSYGEHALRWTGVTSCLWSIKGGFLPYPYLEGIFLELLGKTNARNVTVVGRQTGPLDSEYDISWE